MPPEFVQVLRKEEFEMKKAVKIILNFIEIYLPTIAFLVVFVTYLIMIFYRYIFHAQLSQVYEINSIAFVWCSVFAATYGLRRDGHVVFGILYDKAKEKTKLAFRLIGNFSIFCLFITALPYVYNTIMFAGKRKSSVLGLPFSVIFFPFLIFVVLIIIGYAILLVKDFKLCIEKKKGKAKI